MTRESPPFPLGQTAYEGDSTLITNAGLNHLRGMEWTFRDNDEDGTGVITSRSGRDRVFRIVKNDHSSAVTPKLGARLDTYGQEIAGLCAEDESGFDFGIVDEHLPAAGCAVGDLCWVCISGPATCVADGAGTNVADGDMVVFSTAGKVRKIDVTELDGDLYSEINSRVGRSIHGSTITTDGADCVVNVLFGG